MTVVHQTWAISLRHLRQLYRQWAFVGITLTQPVIWLLLFGALFRKVTEIPGFGGGNYESFLTPGIVIMTALFSAGWTGMTFIDDMESGVMDRMLVAPAWRAAMMVGSLSYQAVVTIIQSLVIILLGWATGARFPGGVPGVVVLIAVAVLIALAVGALSNGLALVARQRESVIAASTATVLPLSFLSTTFLAAAVMPSWIRTVSRYNPVNWAVTAGRLAVGSHVPWSTVGSYVAFLAFTVVACTALATSAYRSYQRSM
jgi:ABC-2 type transport system permease protein